MRDYTKFFTPKNIADLMVSFMKVKLGDIVLEPHAGNGALLKAIHRRYEHFIIVESCEINPDYEQELRKWSNDYYIGDFLGVDFKHQYDCIICNPPFGNETNLINHFYRMWSLLKYGGQLIMLSPISFTIPLIGNRNPRVDMRIIRNWAKNADGTTTDICIRIITKN